MKIPATRTISSRNERYDITHRNGMAYIGAISTLILFIFFFGKKKFIFVGNVQTFHILVILYRATSHTYYKRNEIYIDARC